MMNKLNVIGISMALVTLLLYGMGGHSTTAVAASAAAAPVHTETAAKNVHILETAVPPNDPLIPNQSYLKLIHAEEAWKQTTGDEMVIAVVDTGIDLQHPDLKQRLVPGINLINPKDAPDDDNGHGTNVAGILAAITNNESGIAGLSWKAKLMPIKAIESDGNGDMDKLGEGIRYAVDHGARIVVLSLGLNEYSPLLEDAVQYAEDHGVLLVAATGNDGQAVKYPAAYPTVVAVGGARADGEPVDLSNFGPEVDVIAPWDVFTTFMGGGYNYNSGTSMAAPQVAGVAALIWSKYPWLKPYQVRDLIRQSAQDVGEIGWDPHAGFGLLRADQALTTAISADLFEPNDRLGTAKPLPLDKSEDASLSSAQDKDFYTIQAPYDGSVFVQIKPERAAGLRLTYYASDKDTGVNYTKDLDQGVRIDVKKGLSYIKLESDGPLTGSLVYHVSAKFSIYRDAFEDNDRLYKASVLPSRTQTVTGTFHQIGDEDWFRLPINLPGKLKITVSVDTSRIDPVLTVQKKGESPVVFDQKGYGEPETTLTLNVESGDYYIMLKNRKDGEYPVTGEYTLQIDYTTRYVDPNEPNDRPYEATVLQPDEVYEGNMDNDADADWYKFRLDAESLVRLKLTDIPEGRTMSVSLTDSSLKNAGIEANSQGASDWTAERVLKPGTYYIRLTADGTFANQLYRLQLEADRMSAGFADISGHWAEKAIVSFIQSGVVNGKSEYRFEPDQPITRAEGTALLDRLMHLSGSSTAVSFSDLSAGHWAYQAITRASSAGLVGGYPDGTFRPDQPMTRMEMAALVSQAAGLRQRPGTDSPFEDISGTYWGADILRGMKEDGYLTGFSDGTFHPESSATRAEFVYLLSRIWN